MAVANPPLKNPNTISGRVLLKENGRGIPDLLVVVYDLDPDTRPEENFNLAGTDINISQPTPRNFGDRIGSVLTDMNGAWSLLYDDSEFRNLTPAEKRPDLLLIVQGPEDADKAGPEILFSSKILRVDSGKREESIIRLTKKQLVQAQILPEEIHPADTSTQGQLQQIEEEKVRERALKKGIQSMNQKFETEDKTASKPLKDFFKSALLADTAVLAGMDNMLQPGKTIPQVQDTVYQTGTTHINETLALPAQPAPHKGLPINLVLTQEEKDALDPYVFYIGTGKYYDLPETEINVLMRKRETDDGIGSILFSDNPISKFCIQKSAEEKCAIDHSGIHPPVAVTDPGHPHMPGDPLDDTDDHPVPVIPKGISSADIPYYLEKLLADKSSDHFQLNGNYEGKRPDDSSVQKNVDKFALQKGPADATAFYDFHSLQIAFRHVWQQLLDETLVNLGETIHQEQENSGRKGFLQTAKERIDATGRRGAHALAAVAAEHIQLPPEEIPADILAAFDISRLEYDALDSSGKKMLLAWAQEINTKENMSSWTVRDHRGGQNTVTTYSPSQVAAYINLIREKGERLLDNVRINKPFSTHQLLQELQERLQSKYEFTVFAADRDYHSVNFGIMNTFRQKWEPIAYQAGRLVKTIPLSPKEERKYSVKTNMSSKTSRKLAQKNNSSLNQEINSTSRSESEIVARAQDKSNFNMGAKVDYSHFSSEVGFTKEAQKETSQNRKDFREAVIKAAQEFKEERSMEINSEDDFSSEYNESGTIVNPNDELSVTYLFYELQRRYRVSEQLYRVMPVVMVAQEVPAPDAITEAWVIAHDWILNRVLLDDSFRGSLQYLAQKNVGDDFAIRELRKNLRQQRTLVTNLQVEFAKLQSEVDDKYAMLQSQVTNRIDEEHDKRFYKWWWWWGSNNRPQEPPDPEMAKAMEQAASDDHKHAVEQAEKMAMSVQREVNALHTLTTEYNAVMREHLDRITQTRRLLVHIKENILYYMQAIWSLEPPDQRFMRLYKVPIPTFEATRRCILQDKPVEDVFEQFRAKGKKKHVGWLHAEVTHEINGNPAVQPKQLVELADLDNLLGFKGNYMIFPLKEHNPLTALMAAPYIDEAFGVMDPDQLSNINLAEFSKYVCCLHDEQPALFNDLKDVLANWLTKLMKDPLRNGDEVIIPTGSLFIEMLPSKQTLLEDFKLKHRDWDVYKVQAEVRKMELENIRYAARLLNEERTDPEIEKQVLVNGHGLEPGIDVDN